MIPLEDNNHKTVDHENSKKKILKITFYKYGRDLRRI